MYTNFQAQPPPGAYTTIRDLYVIFNIIEPDIIIINGGQVPGKELEEFFSTTLRNEITTNVEDRTETQNREWLIGIKAHEKEFRKLLSKYNVPENVYFDNDANVESLVNGIRQYLFYRELRKEGGRRRKRSVKKPFRRKLFKRKTFKRKTFKRKTFRKK